jgi:hypothetical protein
MRGILIGSTPLLSHPQPPGVLKFLYSLHSGSNPPWFPLAHVPIEQRKYALWLTDIQLLASAIVWKALIPTNSLEN